MTASRLKLPLFWTLQLLGWSAFGAAMLAWGLSYWAVDHVLANKGVLVVIGFVLTLLFRHVYRAARERRTPPALLALVAGALSFGGAAVWIELQYLLLSAYHGLELRWIPIQPGSLLYHGFVLLAWSLLYYGVNAWFDLEAERERAERAEALAREARAMALQSQLEPHFLFNTLNAISTLVVEGRSSAATRMLARLSEFLRLTLDAAGTPEIPVADEIEFVRRYLEIEQVRFGDRLRATIDVEPDAMGALVPALVLQPLVENAVKHGVLPRVDGGSVAVTVVASDGLVRLSVADDGPGLPARDDGRRGIGLTNTAARLEELYGARAGLRLVSAPEGGLVATVELPLRVAASAEEARL